VARAWRSWSGLTRYMGDFQARLVLTLLYFSWMVPFAVLMRVFRDPLDMRGLCKSTAWKKRAGPKRDLQGLRRQF
jgi:hypothetical protein